MGVPQNRWFIVYNGKSHKNRWFRGTPPFQETSMWRTGGVSRLFPVPMHCTKPVTGSATRPDAMRRLVILWRSNGSVLEYCDMSWQISWHIMTRPWIFLVCSTPYFPLCFVGHRKLQWHTGSIWIPFLPGPVGPVHLPFNQWKFSRKGLLSALLG